MNLIDQEVLLERIREARDIAEYGAFPAVESGLYQAEKIIQEMKPVKDGEHTFWTGNGKCSRCGYVPAKSMRIRNYCPKCGADNRRR